MLDLLRSISDRIDRPARCERIRPSLPVSTTLDPDRGLIFNERQGEPQEPSIRAVAEVDEPRHSRPPIERIMRQLRTVTLRFSSEDQNITHRAVSTLLSLALEAINNASTQTVARTNWTPVHLTVVDAFIPLACTFLVLFMMCKLSSVTRSLGWASGTVIVVGLCDEVFVLDVDSCSTWEVRRLRI